MNIFFHEESTIRKSRNQNKNKETWRQFKKNRTAVIGLILVIFFTTIAIFADLIVPYDVAINQTSIMRQAPSAEHWFGTDRLGRDVFARIIHGTRPSLIIGLAGTAVPVFLGLIIGAASGYFGGRFDEIVMRFMDMLMSIPGTLLALAIVAALGANAKNLIIALAVSSIPLMAREDRALVMSIADQDFVKAAKSYCTGDLRIIFKYLVPNCIGPIIVQATMCISGTILAAASLSFLGMGVQPPQPEWGYMLADAKNFIRTAPFLIIIPGLVILIVALSFNLVGDGLQDAFNPKLKN